MGAFANGGAARREKQHGDVLSNIRELRMWAPCPPPHEDGCSAPIGRSCVGHDGRAKVAIHMVRKIDAMANKKRAEVAARADAWQPELHHGD